MVDITQEVQNELDSILETYSGSRIPRENGASAFQNWWWQVQTHIQNLDKSQIDKPDGINLPYEIPYWGDIKYSKYTIGQDIFILVTYIKFNEANFFQFIKYHRYSKKGEPVIVGDLNFNYKLIKVQGSRLYGIMTPYDEVLIKPCYDRIIPFYHCSENFNRIHAIGIKNGRCYAVDLDGNTEKLSMDVKELMSVGCRHHHDLDESKLKKKLFIENNNATNKFRNMNTLNKQTIRLTETQLHNLIKESVNVLLNEMDLDRNYTDDSGNKISGKEGLQKGDGLAMLNQMKHLYKVLFNFLKTIKNRGGIYLTKQSDVRLNRPIDGKYEEDITNYGLKFLQALEGEIKSFEYYTPNYWIEKTKGYDPFDPKHDHFHGNPI